MVYLRWLLTRQVGTVRVSRIVEMTLTLVVLSLALAGGGGGGEGIDFNGNLSGISATICNAANFIYGPVGWSIAVAILIWGIVRAIAGTSGGYGLIIGSLVGMFVLLALPTMISALTFGECTIAGTGGG